MAPDEDAPAPPAAQDEDVAPPEGAEPSPRSGASRAAPTPSPRTRPLLALTRAARSFTLYDPSNKVVRTLIGDYRDKLRDGRSTPSARSCWRSTPSSSLLGREVVYLEKDRERSLAFRLFRDGVRRIALRAAARRWEEMLRLLADPLDPLHRRAAAGGRPRHPAAQGRLRRTSRSRRSRASCPRRSSRRPPDRRPAPRRHRRATRPPPQWDLPLPALPGGRAPAAPAGGRRSSCERLRAEEAEEAVPRQALRAVAELLHAPGAAGPRGRARLRPRGAGVPAGRAAGATWWSSSAACVRQALAATPEAAAAFLGSFLDARTLEALVARAAARTRGAARRRSLELLDAAPAATLDRLVDLLAEEGDGPRAPLLRRLVVRGFRHAPRGARGPAARGRAARPPVALLRLLAEVDPPAALARGGRGRAARGRRAAARGAAAARAARLQPRDRARAAPPRRVAVRGGARRGPARHGRPGRRRASSPRCRRTRRSTRPPAPPPRPRRWAGRSPRPRRAPPSALRRAGCTPKGGGLLGRLVKMPAPPALQRVALAGLRGAGRGRGARRCSQLLADHGEARRGARRRRRRSRARPRPGGRRG